MRFSKTSSQRHTLPPSAKRGRQRRFFPSSSAAAALLVLFLAGCAWPPWNPSPVPTPTPTPPPNEKQIPPEGQQCHLMSPPAHAQCYDNPPNGESFEEWKPNWGYVCALPEGGTTRVAVPGDCPVAPPLPEPQCSSFVNRGGMVEAMSGACDCWIGHEWAGDCQHGECAVEDQLIPSTCAGANFNATVKQATDALGNLSGGDPQENLRILAEKIKQQSGRKCVFAGVEAVFLKRPDGLYEENHAVFFGNGGWTGNGFGKFIGCHEATEDPTKPPPAGECPAPHPDLESMKFKRDERGSHLDTTWVTVGQEPFCREIGMSPMADGTLRAGCPVRPEGDPERPICESELCAQKWECNGQPTEGWHGNPAQTDCEGHWKTWCSAPGSTAVAEGDR